MIIVPVEFSLEIWASTVVYHEAIINVKLSCWENVTSHVMSLSLLCYACLNKERVSHALLIARRNLLHMIRCGWYVSKTVYIYISTIAGRDYCSKHRSRSFLLLIFVMKQRGWEKISLILFFPSQLKWKPDRRKREWRATAASITYPPLMHDWKTSASLEDCIIYTRQNQEASSSYS